MNTQFKRVAVNPPYMEVSNGIASYHIPMGVDLKTWQPLSETYSKDKDNIYRFDGAVFQKHRNLIDIASFQVVLEDDVTHCYFKDIRHVYIESYMCSFSVLEYADPARFTLLDGPQGFSTDFKYDYYFNKLLPYKFTEATLMNTHYAEADGKVYAGYINIIEGADLNSFLIPEPDLVPNVAKDKNHVYFRDKIVAKADACSFRFIPECVKADRAYYNNCDIHFYAADKNSAYFINTIDKVFKPIKSKSLSIFSFKVVDDHGYAYDREYVYAGGKRKK